LEGEWSDVDRRAFDFNAQLTTSAVGSPPAKSNVVGGTALPTSVAIPDNHADRATSMPGVFAKAWSWVEHLMTA
jgi:hypothetical protein